MPGCIVFGCNTGYGNQKNEEKIQSFPIPPLSKRGLRAQWLERISREDFKPSDHSRVCAKHFAQDAFVPDLENLDRKGAKKKKKSLKEYAIPTLLLPHSGGNSAAVEHDHSFHKKRKVEEVLMVLPV